MSALRHYLLCLLVALPVAIVGIVSVQLLHSSQVWPGCAVSAFLGASTALDMARRQSRGGR